MNRQTETMISVVNILSEYGWVERSKVTESDVEVQWTEEGKHHIEGIWQAICLPKLTPEQKKCLRWLAWHEFGHEDAPPPNL